MMIGAFSFIIVLVITGYKDYSYLKKYIQLKKKGLKVNAKIVWFGPPDGWRFRVPKLKYELAGQVYDNFLMYTYTSILPRKIGNHYHIYVDPDHPEDCILASPYPIVFDTVILIMLVTCVVVSTISWHNGISQV
jgi:hypothetical protein